MPYNFLRYEIVEFGNWKKDCSRPFRFQISSCNLHSELYTLLLNQFLRVEDEERILKSSQLPQHTIFVPCYLDFTSCCKWIEMASFTFRSYPHSEILYLYESYTFVGRLPTCSICDIYIYIYRLSLQNRARFIWSGWISLQLHTTTTNKGYVSGVGVLSKFPYFMLVKDHTLPKMMELEHLNICNMSLWLL